MLSTRLIEHKILYMLADGPAEVSDMYHNIEDICSLPNLYKKIQHMIDAHMLVKKWKLVSLNSLWILWLKNLIQKVDSRSVDIEDLHIDIPHGSSRAYHAWSLFDLDVIWWSLLVQLNMYYDFSKTNYIYNAHTYHIYGMQNHDTFLFEEIGDKNDYVTKFLIWNGGYMNEKGVEIINRLEKTSALIDTDIPIPRSWYCLNIVWDYYLEVVFPIELARSLESYFSTINEQDPLDKSSYIAVFHEKHDMKVTLYRNVHQSKLFSNIVDIAYKKKARRDK